MNKMLERRDNDFYTAIIAKGLLRQISTFNIGLALQSVSRMWEDLPVGEPAEVRIGKWTAPVRFHNSRTVIPITPKIGTDFCWEKSSDILRIYGREEGVHKNVCGLNKSYFKNKVSNGIDAFLEAGGLDYIFPRVLMSYWLNEPLEFSEINLDPLEVITCLPFRDSPKDICNVDLILHFANEISRP